MRFGHYWPGEPSPTVFVRWLKKRSKHNNGTVYMTGEMLLQIITLVMRQLWAEWQRFEYQGHIKLVYLRRIVQGLITVCVLLPRS